MENIGFIWSSLDICVYFKDVRTTSQVYLLLYVGDMLLVGKSRSKINKLKDELNSEFKMKDLGSPGRILGIDIRRDKKLRKLVLSQEAYVNKILIKFGMVKGKQLTLNYLNILSFQMLISHNMRLKENTWRVPYAN